MLRLREEGAAALDISVVESLLDACGGVRQKRLEVTSSCSASVKEGAKNAVEASGHSRIALALGLPQLPGPCRRDEAVGLGYDVPERIRRRAKVEAVEIAGDGVARLRDCSQ